MCKNLVDEFNGVLASKVVVELSRRCHLINLLVTGDISQLVLAITLIVKRSLEQVLSLMSVVFLMSESSGRR